MEKQSNHCAWYDRRARLAILCIGLVCCLLLGWLQPAHAGVSIELSLVQLVQRTAVVLVGTPVESQSHWESSGDGHTRLVTYHRITVDKVVAGQLDGTETWVRCLGGRLGNVAQRVEGEAVLPAGKKLLLFLGSSNSGSSGVVGMAQGVWLIERGHDGIERVRTTPYRGMLIPSKEGPSAETALGGRTLQDAIAAVASVWPNRVR